MALVQGADYQSSEHGARIYIGVADLDASLGRALTAGAGCASARPMPATGAWPR